MPGCSASSHHTVQVVSSAKGRLEFDFTPAADPSCVPSGAADYCPNSGIHVRLLSTNPANPLRNLRLVMPGFEATHQRQPFHPWFLKSLERFSVSWSWFLSWAVGIDTGLQSLPASTEPGPGGRAG
jgi:hypothetical protein